MSRSRRKEDGFISIFFSHCYLLFTVCNCKLLVLMRLSVTLKRKSFQVLLFWSQADDTRRQLQRLSCVIIRQTIELRSRCREQQLFDFKGPDNSVCLIIRLSMWLTDKAWLSPQRFCDLVSQGKRIGQARCCIKTIIVIPIVSSKKKIAG